MKNISTTQWVAWIIATATAAFTIAAYAFTNFETKDHAKETKADIYRLLESMDKKLDHMNYKLDRVIRK